MRPTTMLQQAVANGTPPPTMKTILLLHPFAAITYSTTFSRSGTQTTLLLDDLRPSSRERALWRPPVAHFVNPRAPCKKVR